MKARIKTVRWLPAVLIACTVATCNGGGGDEDADAVSDPPVDMPSDVQGDDPPDTADLPDSADTAIDPDADAGDGGEDTVGPGCGNGVCDDGEDWESCPQDCTVPPEVATLLWFEDWELAEGGYGRWTSSDYGSDWNDGLCHDNGYSEGTSVSPTHSHRSEITCSIDQSHRGYGGLQFDGDSVVPAYTNTGTGIDAPHGVVNIFWSRLDVPYAFGDGKWFSFWTVNNSCDWSDRVVTLGLENASNVLTPAHILNTGGTVEFDPEAPAFPVGEWARITIYINYHDGVMHLWQDGRTVCHCTFSRPAATICQWHWGAYASGDNDDIVLYEDDNSIWKLNRPWTDFSVEPRFVVEP
jgi:hypothetical protein